MSNPWRHAGASEAFGERHPYWALVMGGARARAHAHAELGRRHWLVTLFGHRIGAVVVMAAGVLAGWRVTGRVDWSRVWPWMVVGVVTVVVVTLVVRRRRSPWRY